MFEAFFTDSCLRYRIEVINGIDFYGLGFGMVRGESMGKWISQWMQKGETASVLITNTKLPDTSGFEFAERIRSQCPRVRVIFVTDTPSFAEAQQAVRFGAYAYLLKSDGIEALQDAIIRVSEELHAESREEAYGSTVCKCAERTLCNLHVVSPFHTALRLPVSRQALNGYRILSAPSSLILLMQ